MGLLAVGITPKLVIRGIVHFRFRPIKLAVWLGIESYPPEQSGVETTYLSTYSESLPLLRGAFLHLPDASLLSAFRCSFVFSHTIIILPKN